MKEPFIFDEISDILLSLLVINSYFFAGTILKNRCVLSNMVHMVNKSLYEILRLRLKENR